jgi:signal transduction protein with GAF and PtsI domain
MMAGVSYGKKQRAKSVNMRSNNVTRLETKPQKSDLHQKLKELRSKQKLVDAKWKQAGDRNLLSCFVELVPMALNVARCSIFVLNPKSSRVWLQCGTGLKENAIHVSLDGSLVGETIATGRPLIATDLEERAGEHYEVSLKTGFQPRNALCVPIMSTESKKATGAIQVLNKVSSGAGQDPYTKKDIEVLQKLADNIQMTIENIYLRQEFSRISRAMSQQIKMLEGKLGLL